MKRPVDSEILQVFEADGDCTVTRDLGRSFLYARYNADLSYAGLTSLGFPGVDPDSIQKMDCPSNIPALLEIGQAAASEVQLEHFGSFL